MLPASVPPCFFSSKSAFFQDVVGFDLHIYNVYITNVIQALNDKIYKCYTLTKKQVNIRLDEHLINKIQESGLSQTKFIEKAITNLGNEETKLVVSEVKNVRVQL